MFKRKYDKLERNFISIFNTICCCFDTYKRFDFFFVELNMTHF